MRCRFARDDGAYVLGALAPAERLEFEQHLARCDDCTRAVRELAGLSGLLGRVDARVLEGPVADASVPPTLLPALTRGVARARRRRAGVAAGLAAAAVAVVAVGAPVIATRVSDGDGASPPAAAPSGSSGGPAGGAPTDPGSRRMVAVGEVPVAATLGLEPVAWGTRLLLTCTYEPRSVEYALPPAVDYVLVVRLRRGATERVGSWRSISGATMRLAAATSADRADIASVEVRTPGGRVVLRLGV